MTARAATNGTANGKHEPHRPKAVNLDAERATIGSALRDNTVIPSIRRTGLCVEDFYSDANGKIWDTILLLREDGRGADLVTLAELLCQRNLIRDVRYPYLADLLEAAPTAANAEYYAKIVVEKSRRRALARLGEQLERQADGPLGSTEELLNRASSEIASIRGAGPAPVFSLARMTAREFFEAEFPLEYLIEEVLAAGQPSIKGAMQKGMKTTLILEQGISLASGLPFLGKFRVPKPVRVGIISLESGHAVIQETVKRIAKAKNWESEDNDNLRFCFDRIRLDDPRHVDAIRRFVEEEELQLLDIDPAYLTMPIGDNAGNLFSMGEFLGKLTDLGQETGCTMEIVHHLRKNSANPFSPPSLEDLAWSGFAEWARQGTLISRREKFDPDSDGEHKLWISFGGSAGHSSAWAMDIREGKRTDPEGRRWCAMLKTISIAREQASEDELGERTAKRELKEKAAVKGHRDRTLKAFARFPDGESETALAKAAGMNAQTFGGVLTLLLDEGTVCRCKITKKNKQEYDGFRLRNATLFREDDPDTPTLRQNHSDNLSE